MFEKLANLIAYSVVLTISMSIVLIPLWVLVQFVKWML